MATYKSGPAISEADIQRVETEYGYRFPESYRRFLLHTNGREYKRKVKIRWPGGRKMQSAYLELWPLDQAVSVHRKWCGYPRDEHDPSPMVNYMLTVGEMDQTTLFLCLAPMGYGHLYKIGWGHEGVPGSYSGDPKVEYPVLVEACEGYKVCDDFKELIDGLEPGKDDKPLVPGQKSAAEIAAELYMKLFQKMGNKKLSHAEQIIEAKKINEQAMAEATYVEEDDEEDEEPARKRTDDFDKVAEQRFPGKPLTEEKLAEVEKSAGLSLPGDYRAYLLTKNGGYPHKPVQIEGARKFHRISELFAFTDPWKGHVSVLQMRESLMRNCGLPGELLPLGYGSDAADMFLAIGGPMKGHVYVIRYQGIREDEALKAVAPVKGQMPSQAFWEYLEKNAKVADSFAQVAEELKIK